MKTLLRLQLVQRTPGGHFETGLTKEKDIPVNLPPDTAVHIHYGENYIEPKLGNPALWLDADYVEYVLEDSIPPGQTWGQTAYLIAGLEKRGWAWAGLEHTTFGADKPDFELLLDKARAEHEATDIKAQTFEEALVSG